MKSFNEIRDKVILEIYNEFQDCFRITNTGLSLIDPLEQKVIGFHYGETHFGVGLLIYGFVNHDTKMFQSGISLLTNFLNNVNEYQSNSGYHWDFNNFALCVLIEFIENNHIMIPSLPINQLKEFIINQKDSNHATINWLPMRVYVNSYRYKWTKKSFYVNRTNKYLKQLSKAKYEDGFYEDFLPKGKSFNFQYHIYTTTEMLFLSKRITNINIPLKSISRCCDIIDLNGDLNYLGRGCNQIFAWGPALYLFYETVLEDELDKTVNYFFQQIMDALKNRNLILCDEPGAKKNWWWDYHYSSVYYGHLLFWLTLTFIDTPKEVHCDNETYYSGDSGVTIYKDNHNFCVVFLGRNHYLAEKGPIVANIIISDRITIFKGPLGPFGGMFGNKYANYISSIRNYLGPILQKTESNRLITTLIYPKNIVVNKRDKGLFIEFYFKKKYKDILFQVPLLCEKKDICIQVIVDQLEVELVECGNQTGPYGKTTLYQTRKITCDKVSLFIIDNKMKENSE